MSWTSGLEHILREDEPLAPFTWFRLGGPADFFLEPTDQDELQTVVQRCREEGIRVRLLGAGSNVLVSSKGVSGAVISIFAPAFCEISRDGQTIRAGGGTKLSHVVSTSVKEGLSGLEPLVGIPGSIGGALHGNSGSHGTDVGQWCRSATVMTGAGEIMTRSASDLRFDYRQSSLNELVILNADFQLEPDDPVELTRRMQKTWIVRRSSQPSSEYGSGCIFKDPQGMSATDLIEDAGLKGARVGGATVSDRDANFIVAESGATSDDICRLIEMIASRVSATVGVDLERQIEVW